MATTLKDGVEIVNESLRTLGYEYQIDTTSTTTMTAGLEAIGAYAPSQRNAIMEQMNLILQQRNYGVMFDSAKNKFRVFLTNLMENGFGIEDVFHELISGVTPLWDGNATDEEIAEDLVSYDDNQIHKFFHADKMEKQFKTTVDRRNYEKVFTAYGVTRYIDTKLANLSWSAEVWLQSQIINVAKRMVENGKIVFSTNNNLNTKEGVNNATEKIKATVDGFLTPSVLYNLGVYDEDDSAYRSVVNITDSKEDIFIITTPQVMERLKVQGYSNAFNLSQFELEGRIIYAPAGTDLGEYNGEEVLFIVLDRRAIVAGIRRWEGTSFYVPNVLRTNHWLNVEGIIGYNTIFNAVAFTGESVGDFFDKSEGGYLYLQLDPSETIPDAFVSAFAKINGKVPTKDDFAHIASDENNNCDVYQYVGKVKNFEIGYVATLEINGNQFVGNPTLEGGTVSEMIVPNNSVIVGSTFS